MGELRSGLISPPAAFGAAGAEVKIELVAAVDAAATAHAEELQDQLAGFNQQPIGKREKNGEENAVEK